MVSFKIFLIFIFGVVYNKAALSDEKNSNNLYQLLSKAQKRTWLNLLHFDKSHRPKTRIDEKGFFISIRGGEDPRKEFIAFLEEYSKPKRLFGRAKLPIECAYPARTLFLKKIGVLKPKKTRCPDFNLWLKEVRPVAISIVFSTAYPNNPASMFGHTFLRFHKKESDIDLLDYGANYSAITNKGDNGLIYALKGLFGGYKGYFDLAPYYLKINEYVYGENRDLIEYKLKLKQEQIDIILAHLWELYHGASFDYFFTTENCSFHLASLLNVALEKDLTPVKRWYFLPVDLIQQIYQVPNLVQSIKSRPSRLKKVNQKLKKLSTKAKKEILRKIRKNEDFNSNQNLEIRELDAFVSILNYLKFKQKESFPEQRKKILRKTLLLVSRLKNYFVEKEEKSPSYNLPHIAHLPQRISLGLNSTKNLSFSLRNGYHDLLARDRGLEPFGQFRFFGFEGQYLKNKKKIKVREIQLIDIISLFPSYQFEKQVSWKIGTRIEDMPEREDCKECLRWSSEGKLGITFGDRLKILSFLAGIKLELNDKFQKRHEEFFAYEIITAYNLNLNREKELKVLINYEGLHNLGRFKNYIRSSIKTGLNYSWRQNWELRLRAEFQNIIRTRLNNFSPHSTGERFDLQIAKYF